jgi:hypothetical protein
VSHVCDPPSNAWTRLVELLQTYSAMNGIDPLIGRKLPRLLREAGLTDIRVNPIIHIYPPDHGRRNLLLDFAENLSDRFVAEKLIDGLRRDRRPWFHEITGPSPLRGESARPGDLCCRIRDGGARLDRRVPSAGIPRDAD